MRLIGVERFIMKLRTCEIAIDVGVDRVIEIWKDRERFHEWMPCFLRGEQVRGEFGEAGSECSAIFLNGEVIVEERTRVISSELPGEVVSRQGFCELGGDIYFIELEMRILFESVGEGRSRVCLGWHYLRLDEGDGRELGRVNLSSTDFAANGRWLVALKGFAERVGSQDLVSEC